MAMSAMKEKLSVSIDGEELTEAMVLIRTRAPDLESVKKLNCWACNIGDISVVRCMPNLEVCSLTINKISSLRDFANCYNLQELYVRTNNIQQLSDIQYLRNLKKLRSLWLSENPCATGDKYRMTVLKALPHLQKLDNIAVTECEILLAREIGDDLPLFEELSDTASKETSSSSEDYKDEAKGESVSEKWARPRQKRQQKKREDYWKEIKGSQSEGGEAKSGDDSGESGEYGRRLGLKGSSDSGDGDEWSKAKEKVKNTSRNEAGNVPEEISGEDSGKADFVKDNVGVECRSESSSRVLCGIKVEMPNSRDDLDGKEWKDKNDNKLTHKMVEVCESGDGYEAGNKKSNEEKDLTNWQEADQDMCVTNKMYGPVVVAGRHFNESGCSHGNNSLLKIYQDSDLVQEDDRDSINMLDITSAEVSTGTSHDCNSIVNKTNVVKNESVHFNDELISGASAVKATDQAKTPLLDKTRLEDTLDISDPVRDRTPPKETLELESSTDLMLGISTFILFGDQATQEAVTEARTTEKPATFSVEENRKTANGTENFSCAESEARPEKREQLNANETSTSTTVKCNVLQAVLCLVQELDKDSLNIVVSAVQGRIDSMSCGLDK